jgi:beta-phosphoglucomutase
MAGAIAGIESQMTPSAVRPLNQLRAVIFDMDGVIVDSHPAHRVAWRHFLRDLGREVSDQDLDFILDGRKRREILRHFLGELSENELLEHGKRKDEFFQRSGLQMKPIPGIGEFIRALKKNKILTAVATSASLARTQSTLAGLHLTDYFDATVTSNDIAEGKPDPAIYRLACERLNTSPHQAIAIEDAVSGIHAARAAGLRCLGLAKGDLAGQLKSAGAIDVIQSFSGFSFGELKTLFFDSCPERGNSASVLAAYQDK